MSKKAAIEVQFNWIFIIIAGALILLFFISIVTKQKAISDTRISSTILVDLETILTGAKVSTGTVNLIKIPSSEIRFECNNYRIKDVNIPVRDKIIFSPDILKGVNLITWALDWNMPYWITNFLYVTSPEVRYIIVNDTGSDFAETIYDSWLPEEIGKEFVNAGADVADKNNYRVKYVFVNQNPASLGDPMLNGIRRMDNEHVTAINISPDPTRNKGMISFFEKSGSTWQLKGTTPYLGRESLIGAIFSHDIEMYNCSMKKAFEKLAIVTDIYLNRSKELVEFYGAAQCSVPHTSAVADLQVMSDSSDFNKDDIDQVYDAIYWTDGLNHNNGIAKLYSCVLIY